MIRICQQTAWNNWLIPIQGTANVIYNDHLLINTSRIHNDNLLNFCLVSTAVVYARKEIYGIDLFKGQQCEFGHVIL